MADLTKRTHYAETLHPVSPTAANVVLVGAPSPLRSAVERQLVTTNTLLACLDKPADLPRALTSPAIGARNGLDGAAVVIVTVPQLPGLSTRLRHRFRTAALAASLESMITTARDHGAARVVVLSTIFCHDGGNDPLQNLGSPTLAAAEVAPSVAAEGSARLFASLGGDSVVLRLGWTWGREEGITRRVLSAARHGWRLIDGDPAAWVAMIAEADAARAVLPALTIPAGTYDVTDGAPVTQGMLNARMETALDHSLHSLLDPDWGCDGILFGPSRMIVDGTFTDLAGWRPNVTPVAETLDGLLSRRD
jgi:nucleoside-diphosphate-sugar epimerase